MRSKSSSSSFSSLVLDPWPDLDDEHDDEGEDD